MAKTKRIYCTVSYSGAIASETDGMLSSYTMNLTGSATQFDTVIARSRYDFTAQETWPIPPIDEAVGVAMRFNLIQDPELFGKRVTRVQGPYVYLRDKLCTAGPVEGHAKYTGYGFNSPFFHFFNEYPDQEKISNYDALGQAAVKQYINVNDSGRGGREVIHINSQWEQLTMAAVGAASYPQLAGKQYGGTVEAEFDSQRGEFPPYIDLTYEDVQRWAEELAPTGTVNGVQATAFQWKFVHENEKNIIGEIVQASAKLRWRPAGAAEYTQYNITGAQESYTVPANTFHASAIEWQLLVKSNDNVEAEDPGWITLTVANPVIKATGLLPKGSLIDGTKSQRFSWQTPNIADGDLNGYEAQISANNGVKWEALSTGAGARRFFDVPGSTYESGTYVWRVRCKNKAGVWGPWSDPEKFLVETAILPPVIVSATPKPRPTVEWTSAGQRMWQLQVTGAGGAVLYDTGPAYGGTLAYRVPVYLPSGPARVRLRVANVFEFWSGWAVKDIVIENKNGSVINLSGRSIEAGMRLQWETAGPYAACYILRDGVPVAKAAGKDYTDWRAVGQHTYTVRGVTAADYYTDSAPLTAVIRVRDAVISDYEDIRWIPLEYHLGGMPTHSEDREAVADIRHLAGRRLPVAEVSEFQDVQHSVAFTLPRDQASQLAALVGKTVLYKDCHGFQAVGFLQRLTSQCAETVGVDFSIIATDCKEEVDYD